LFLFSCSLIPISTAGDHPSTSTQKPTLVITEPSAPETVPTGPEINFKNGLYGKLFIGSYKGNYIEINFSGNHTTPFFVGEYCIVVPSSPLSVCTTHHPNGTRLLNLRDLDTQETFAPFPQVEGWSMDISSSNEVLNFGYVNKQTGNWNIQSYSLKSRKIVSTFSYKYENKIRINPDTLSNNLDQMVGIDVSENIPSTYDDWWFIFDVKTGVHQSIDIPDGIYATEDIEWAPDDHALALLGARAEDQIEHAGAITCSKTLLIYYPKGESSTLSISSPGNQCFTPFRFYANHHLWSGDGTKIALPLGRRNICIVDFSENQNECVLITSYP
jgi:hypothetical protein